MMRRVTHDLVRVHNGLQAMCDDEKRYVLAELATQRFLNDAIRTVVYTKNVLAACSSLHRPTYR